MGVLILTFTVFCPVIRKVNLDRMKILSLFVDIPSNHVMELATKCEDFISTFHEEDDKNDIGESEFEEKDEEPE